MISKQPEREVVDLSRSDLTPDASWVSQVVDVNRLLVCYFSRDKANADILSALSSAEGLSADQSKALLERLAAIVLPQEIWSSLEEFSRTLFYEMPDIADEVPLDFLSNRKGLDKYYLQAARYIVPPSVAHLPRALAPVQLALPDLDQLRELAGSISIKLPGAAPSPSRNPRSRLDLGEPEVVKVLGKLQETSLHVDYGVSWSREKRVRDLLQNFYDGQGGLLDGVRVEICRLKPEAPYIVTIKGDGEYPYDLLVDIGGSTKTASQVTAGFHGEGAKIVPLLLLRSQDVVAFQCKSCNWQLNFEIAKNRAGREKLCYRLEHSEEISGCELTIQSNDLEFVHALCRGLLLFRSSSHPEFLDPDLSNLEGGIRLLPSKERGNLYVGGQRFEVNADDIQMAVEDRSRQVSPNDYTWQGGLLGCSLWTNRSIRGCGRDRIAVSSEFIQMRVVSTILRGASDEELVHLLFCLTDFWRAELAIGELDHPLFNPLTAEIRRRNIITTFPDSCVAVPLRSLDTDIAKVGKLIEKEGKIPCRTSLAALGMSERHQRESLEHIKLVSPTRQEAKRIVLLKIGADLLAAQLFKSGVVSDRVFSLAQIDPHTPVGLFTALDQEVAIPRAIYFGDTILWNREELNSSPFIEAVTTHLHEITHAAGGDDTRIFTIELSRWITVALDTMADPEAVQKLAVLEYLWGAEQEVLWFRPEIKS